MSASYRQTVEYSTSLRLLTFTISGGSNRRGLRRSINNSWAIEATRVPQLLWGTERTWRVPTHVKSITQSINQCQFDLSPQKLRHVCCFYSSLIINASHSPATVGSFIQPTNPIHPSIHSFTLPSSTIHPYSHLSNGVQRGVRKGRWPRVSAGYLHEVNIQTEISTKREPWIGRLWHPLKEFFFRNRPRATTSFCTLVRAVKIK